MAVSDQEIDQLYAERYRLDQLFQNSPEFQDSLENSSVAESRSGTSHKSHRSRRSHERPAASRRRSSDAARRDAAKESSHRRSDAKEPRPSQGSSPSRWPQLGGSPRPSPSTPRSDPSQARRPQHSQPGFSYIYPNADGVAAIEKKPIRRYSFLGQPGGGSTKDALPFKGKLEYFDRISRGSTPEPVLSPFIQGQRKHGSPHRGSTPSSPHDARLLQPADRASPRPDLARRPSLLRIQSRPPESHSSDHTHDPQGTDDQSSPRAKPARPPPPPQILFEDKLLKKSRSPDAEKAPPREDGPSPVHRRSALLHAADARASPSPASTPVSAKDPRAPQERRLDDHGSSGVSANLSRMSSFADIRKERRSSRHGGEEASPRRHDALERHPDRGHHAEAPAEGVPPPPPPKSRGGLKRHESSPAIGISRRSLAVGQARISDSVAQITDSVTQLRRSLSRRVGRSVSRSFSKSITRSLARKYKRQYNDEANAYSDEEERRGGDDGRESDSDRRKPSRPTLSRTFSTLRRNHANYQALFASDKDDSAREPKSLSDIHRFFHGQLEQQDGDAKSQKSQKSQKSSSLPHPIDASVRDEVSLKERHPEKFWTFTTSVVLPDYEGRQGNGGRGMVREKEL